MSAFDIEAVLQIGPTILDHDSKQVTIRRYAPSAAMRDKMVDAFNVIGVHSLTVVRSDT